MDNFGLRRQSAAATALWQQNLEAGFEAAKAASRSACRRTP